MPCVLLYCTLALWQPWARHYQERIYGTRRFNAPVAEQRRDNSVDRLTHWLPSIGCCKFYRKHQQTIERHVTVLDLLLTLKRILDMIMTLGSLSLISNHSNPSCNSGFTHWKPDEACDLAPRNPTFAAFPNKPTSIALVRWPGTWCVGHRDGRVTW